MRTEPLIIIIERPAREWAAKRYRATPEQMEQNRREIAIQRERDERAQRRAFEKANLEDPKK